MLHEVWGMEQMRLELPRLHVRGTQSLVETSYFSPGRETYTISRFSMHRMFSKHDGKLQTARRTFSVRRLQGGIGNGRLQSKQEPSSMRKTGGRCSLRDTLFHIPDTLVQFFMFPSAIAYSPFPALLTNVSAWQLPFPSQLHPPPSTD